MYMGLMIISLVFTGIGMYLSGQLKRKFAKYSQMPVSSGMSGAEIAEKMLRDNGILDVKVTQVQGQLTDHYNPGNKTVNLSTDVYNGRNVAAAAVAAHECGHAVQHATSYAMLQLRSALVPVVSFSAKIQQYLFMLGMVMMGTMGNKLFLMIAIAAFAGTTLFSLVTLPVEFDASNRALAWLESSKIAVGREHDGAKDALKWAALTYVSAALAALVQLLYLVSIFMGRRD